MVMGTKSFDGRQVIYVGAFLTDPKGLQGTLLESPASELLNKCHHLTFAFRPSFDWTKQFFQQNPPGKMVKLTPDMLYVNSWNGIAAMSVEVPAQLKRWVVTGTPHITLGTGSTVSPALSSDLIRGVDSEIVPVRHTKKFDLTTFPLNQIPARIGWFDGSKDRFDLPF